jgi:hypothetical protein
VGAGLGADDRAARFAGDLDVLARTGLAWIAFVLEFDVDPDHLVVIAFDPAQLLRDKLPIMLWNLDVSAPHDNVHTDLPVLIFPGRRRGVLVGESAPFRCLRHLRR